MENKAKGSVVTIRGPVVDVRFPQGETIPDIFTALEVHIGEERVILETLQHLGDNVVRCILFLLRYRQQRHKLAKIEL